MYSGFVENMSLTSNSRSGPDKKQKRYKVECLSCRSTFNNDFKRSHEEACHGGNFVQVQTVGAPENPFVAAKRLKKDDVVTSASDTVLQPSQSDTSLSAITQTEERPSSSLHSVDVIDEFLEHPDSLLVAAAQTTIEEELPEPPLVAEQSIFRESGTYWLQCAGEYAHLIDFIRDGEQLLQKMQSQTAPNQLILTLEMLDSALMIKRACETLEETCTEIINQINTDTNKAVVDDRQPDPEIIHHDPGLRSRIENDNQRNYLMALGPHQPKLFSYPRDDSKHCFNPQWYTEFEYLEYSTAKDAAFCYVCSLFPAGIHAGPGVASTAWHCEGVSSWNKMKSIAAGKKGKLQKHFGSDAHKAALEQYTNFMLKRGHIDLLLDKTKRRQLIEEERQLAFNTEVVKVLADVSRTLARQGLAYRGSGSEESSNYQQIVQLVARHNPVVRRWLDDSKLRPYHTTYLSPTAQNEFIQLIGQEVRNTIIGQVRENGFYSVMADTTPDVSHKDMLSVVIRTVDGNGTPCERLLQIEEAQDKTGAGLAESIVNCLERHALDSANLAFQSYDFAASMSGEFNGAQQKVSQLVGHKVPYAPCQAHRTNTAVEHSCAASQVIADMFNILEELYVFFSSSTKRFHPLLEKLRDIENSLQLRNLSMTRWTARAESLRAVNSSFEGIIDVLVDISVSRHFDSKTKAKALGLQKRVVSFDFIVSLMFMKNILAKMRLVTEALESVELNVIDAITVINTAVVSLQIINNDHKGIDDLIDAAKIFSANLNIDFDNEFRIHHRRRLAPVRFDSNSVHQTEFTLNTFFRREFKEILDTMISLLTDNVQACILSMKPLFDIFVIPVHRKVLTIQNLAAAINLFPSKEGRPDVYALQSEMEVLFDQCSDAKNMAEVMKKARKMNLILKLAFRFIRFVFTAAFSVATNERKFSKLKFIKNTLRSAMGDERLDSLMLLASEKDITDSTDLSHIVSAWARLKQRRIKVQAEPLKF